MKLIATAAIGLALVAPAGLAGGERAALTFGSICHAGLIKTADVAIEPAKDILPGYGTGGFRVTTTQPRAQAFFDNGMQLAHAFAHSSATNAFAEARKLDPDCAMCVWGEAWSRGPTINFTIDDADQKPLVVLADRAYAMAKAHGTPKEQALTSALRLRYRNGGGKGPGDIAYAKAMDALARQYPDDIEINVLAADAWMIPAAQGNLTWTLPRAIVLLEAALKRAPDDTGAIHFYIHASEMSGFPARALPYAEKLQALAPAASHLVHMPSHTYFWSGRFRAATQSNLDAVRIDQANARRLDLKDGVFSLAYHGHNVRYGIAAAMVDGDGAAALTLARGALAPMAKPPSAYLMAPVYWSFGRYGTDTELASLPDPGAKAPYLRAMWRYARGEAAVRRGDAKAAAAEAQAMTLTPADLNLVTDKSQKAVLEIARQVLDGRIAMLERRWPDAVAAYRKAARRQDASLGQGGDPPSWWYPVRRSLAEALLAQGHAPEAATEARATLVLWPYDPLTLLVLAKAEAAQGQPAQGARDLAQARIGWTGDVTAVKAAEI